jgi:hypothetical protein
MLQRLHTAIVAIQGYLVAAMRILTGADFAGLHAKVDELRANVERLLAQLEAEPTNPAILQIKPAVQGAELPGFLQPGATGIGSLSDSGQAGTLQNQIEPPAPLPDPNASLGDQGAEVTGAAEATEDPAGATAEAQAPQADPSPPGQQAA